MLTPKDTPQLSLKDQIKVITQKNNEVSRLACETISKSNGHLKKALCKKS